MSYKWKPSKAAAADYAKKMDAIRAFCQDHGIKYSVSMDSFYFSLDGIDYRVSNHTIAASNRGALDDMGNQVRDFYHDALERPDTVYITAGKTRIIDIYNDLTAGYKLDRRGNRISS